MTSEQYWLLALLARCAAMICEIVGIVTSLIAHSYTLGIVFSIILIVTIALVAPMIGDRSAT